MICLLQTKSLNNLVTIPWALSGRNDGSVLCISKEVSKYLVSTK